MSYFIGSWDERKNKACYLFLNFEITKKIKIFLF